jgi:rod shape-determining protein MreC
MLWDILSRNKNTLSLSFTLTFSFVCLVWQGNFIARGVGFFGKVTDRISGALNSGLSLPGNIWVELDRYRELEQRYAAAQKLIEEYRLEKDKFDILKQDNRSLREALDFQIGGEYPEVRAEVLGIRLNTISPRILIDKGRDAGIEPFMPVYARAHDKEQNLIRAAVGIVVAADSGTAVIQPLNHPAFRLGVRIPDTGQWAMLSGNSGKINDLLLSYVSPDYGAEGNPVVDPAAVVKGEKVVYTSGEGGIFPRGIPVGVFASEGGMSGDFRTAYVRPFAPISRLEFVTVILKKPEPWTQSWNRDENWGDHLVTEFGEPVYPEKDIRRVETPKPEEKKEEPARVEKPAGTTGQTPVNEKPAQENQKPNENQENNPGTAPRAPRRIQNVVPPGN